MATTLNGTKRYLNPFRFIRRGGGRRHEKEYEWGPTPSFFVSAVKTLAVLLVLLVLPAGCGGEPAPGTAEAGDVAAAGYIPLGPRMEMTAGPLIELDVAAAFVRSDGSTAAPNTSRHARQDASSAPGPSAALRPSELHAIVRRGDETVVTGRIIRTEWFAYDPREGPRKIVLPAGERGMVRLTREGRGSARLTTGHIRMAEVDLVAIDIECGAPGELDFVWVNEALPRGELDRRHRFGVDGRPGVQTCYVPVHDRNSWLGMARWFGVEAVALDAPAVLHGLRFLQAGPNVRRAMNRAPGEPDRLELKDESRPALHAPAGTVYEAELVVPENAVLHAGYGYFPDVWRKRQSGCVFTIHALTAGEPAPRELLRTFLDPRDWVGSRYWQDAEIDLAPLAGEQVTLRFTTAVPTGTTGGRGDGGDGDSGAAGGGPVGNGDGIDGGDGHPAAPGDASQAAHAGTDHRASGETANGDGEESRDRHPPASLYDTHTADTASDRDAAGEATGGRPAGGEARGYGNSGDADGGNGDKSGGDMGGASGSKAVSDGGEATGPIDLGYGAWSPPAVVVRGSRAAEGRRNVVVWLVDALRADRLSCYGAAHRTSPHLDRLVREGLIFTSPRAQASWTAASTGSLFTALYPSRHGAERASQRLLPQCVTLAERLERAGVFTMGLVANGHVKPLMNFDQGFDRYVFVRGSGDPPHADAAELFESLLPLLEQNADKPFYLYVHGVDPHGPYTPPPPCDTLFTPDAYSGTIDGRYDPPDFRRLPADSVSEADLAQLRGLYDGEIAWNDLYLGRLVAELRRLGLLEQTMILVTGDHGEEFLDHGGWDHAKTLYAEQIRVPLAGRLPHGAHPAFPAGSVVRDPVRLVDIYPSVLDVFGVESSPEELTELDGRSFFTGEASPLLFSEENRAGDVLFSVEQGGYKLIRRLKPEPGDELYDLRGDPGETKDIIGEHPELAARLVAEGEQILSRRTLQRESVGLDQATQEELRALGYLE